MRLHLRRPELCVIQAQNGVRRYQVTSCESEGSEEEGRGRERDVGGVKERNQELEEEKNRCAKCGAA